MRYFYTIIMICASFCCLATASLELDYQQDVEVLVRLLPHQSFEASFEQAVLDSEYALLEQAEGHLSWMPPAYFDWQVTSPESQQIIHDGQHIWLYDKDLEQVSKYSNMDQFSGSPAFLLSATPEEISEHYLVKGQLQTPPESVFVLTPLQQSDDNIEQMTLVFHESQLFEITLRDQLQQETRIRFSQWQNKPKLTAKDFRFVAPKGVDVYELS